MRFQPSQRKSGFTLLEVLLSLFCASMCIPILLMAITLLTKEVSFSELIQDEIALSQLRHICNVAEDYAFEDTSLSFTYHNERYYLSLKNNHVILQPGTQIFFNHVDRTTFYQIADCIYIQFERGTHSYVRLLTKV